MTFERTLGTSKATARASRYLDACSGTTAKGIFTGQTNGYAVSMLVLKRPKNPGTGKPECPSFDSLVPSK
jgi:hypothetical protein